MVSGDFNLPPQPQFQGVPGDAEKPNEAAAELLAEEHVREEDGSETKTKKNQRTQDSGKSEKSTATNEAGDVVIAGIGSSGNDSGEGGSGGGGHNPQRPELEGVGEISAHVSLEEITSAFIAALFALTMGDVAHGKAAYSAAESELNAIYRNIDSTIDQTNSQIMRNKIKKAREKRLEMEAKMRAVSIIFSVIFAVIMAAFLGIIGALLGAISIALDTTGGMGEGGMVGGLVGMFGGEDTMKNRMIFYTAFLLFIGGLMLLPMVAMRWAAESDIEKTKQESEGLMEATYSRPAAQRAPAAIKQALEEMGVEEELAEILAMISALLLMLTMMLAGQGGAMLGQPGANSGGGTDASSALPKQEGSESPEESSGDVSQGLPEDTPPPLAGDTMGLQPDLSGPEEGLAPSMDELLADDFGSFDEIAQQQAKSEVFTPMSNEEVVGWTKDAAQQVDVMEVFAKVKQIALEEGFPEVLVNDPALEQFVENYGQELAQLSLSAPMLMVESLTPTINYFGEMMDADALQQDTVQADSSQANIQSDMQARNNQQASRNEELAKEEPTVAQEDEGLSTQMGELS
jgi:hypothetical protein